jgi:hypothetical protein
VEDVEGFHFSGFLGTTRGSGSSVAMAARDGSGKAR